MSAEPDMSVTDVDDLVAQYDQILGGKFIPKETSDDDDGNKPPSPRVGSASGAESKPRREFIPDLKKVVQFSDEEGKKHVIGLETYKFKAHRSRHAQVLDEAEEQPFRDYAILLKAAVNDDMRGAKASFSLEIQSDGLKDIFRRVAKRYQELTLDTGADPIVIEYPFRCLFFLRSKLRELSQSGETHSSVRRQLVNLLDFIHAPMGHQQIIEAYNELVPHGKITFPMIWTLYPPYEPVLALYPGQDFADASCYLVESVQFIHDKNDPYWDFQLLCGYHDGDKYHLKDGKKQIKFFDGVKDISQDHLHLIPLNLFEEGQRNEIRESLIKRGKLYVDYCKRDFSFMHYKGKVDLVQQDGEMRLSDWGSRGSMQVFITYLFAHDFQPLAYFIVFFNTHPEQH